MYEIKTEDVYEGFNNDNHSTKSKYYDNGNRLVVGKMKDGTPGVSIEEFVRLNPKMYLYLVDTKNLLRRNFLEMCKQKCCCAINQTEYADVLLNEKFWRHSMNTEFKINVTE